jgi:hypothetical protein
MAIWNILWPFGAFFAHLVIFWQFGIFSPVLVYCVKKNLATVVQRDGLAGQNHPAEPFPLRTPRNPLQIRSGSGL